MTSASLNRRLTVRVVSTDNITSIGTLIDLHYW